MIIESNSRSDTTSPGSLLIEPEEKRKGDLEGAGPGERAPECEHSMRGIALCQIFPARLLILTVFGPDRL